MNMVISAINQHLPIKWHKDFNTITCGIKKTFDIAKRILNSSTFWTAFLSTAALASTVTALTLTSPVGILISTLLISLAINSIFKFKKTIVWDISLWHRIIRSKVCDKKNNKWFHKIDNNIYLGGIPLKEKDSLSKFKQRDITSILSLIEDFEYRKTPITTPISKDEWKKESFTQCQIKAKDRNPLELKDIIDAVQFMKKEVNNGKKVYVHCKSGIGRSATVVCCYFLEKLNLTPEEVVKFVKGKRPITKIREYQFNKIVEYYQNLQEKRKKSFFRI